MSRFYASIQGHRGEATRMGHMSIQGHIRGWHQGVKVYGKIDKDGNDQFLIYKTNGSTDPSCKKLIATINSLGVVTNIF